MFSYYYFKNKTIIQIPLINNLLFLSEQRIILGVKYLVIFSKILYFIFYFPKYFDNNYYMLK